MKKLLFGLSLVILAALLLAGCGTGEAVSRGVSVVQKGEYFVLPDANHQLHIYQYKGADSLTSKTPKVALKDVETGETVTLDYVYQAYAGGIKDGAFFRVGLYQAYAGGIDNSKTYYLQFVDLKSGKMDSPLKVCYDPGCVESKTLSPANLKI